MWVRVCRRGLMKAMPTVYNVPCELLKEVDTPVTLLVGGILVARVFKHERKFCSGSQKAVRQLARVRRAVVIAVL